MLGGEARSRSLIGNAKRSRKQLITFGVLAVAACFLVLFWRLPGTIVAVVLAVIVYWLFLDEHEGNSPLRRISDRRRMKDRRKHGWVDFNPVETRPAYLDPRTATNRRERDGFVREWNTYRDWPDGVDGLYWLESRPGHPAVAWHAPTGENAYVTVTFSVDGPIQGLHGDHFVAEAQYRFGQLLASWGPAQRLVTGIQTVTRMLPADSAFHEAWLQDEVDPASPLELQHDLGQLLDQVSRAAFVQRHYVAIRWDVDGRFQDLARRRGSFPDGTLDLVNEQISQVQRRLGEAGYHRVHAMSGPQLGAVLRHLQHPDWPIDRASDVNVDSCWLPSHDEWSWTEIVVQSPDPLEPTFLQPPSTWLHRTAQLPVGALEVRALDGLWEAPLLTQMGEQVVRTLSSHIYLVPAREAKTAARRDATLDRAEIMAQERKQQIVHDESELALSASIRRYSDLREGSGHHGAVWTQFLTVSAPSTEELADACGLIEDAADDAGFARLDWQDTLQSGAMATTWPLGRGMSPPKRSTASRAMRAATHSSKEGLAS